MKNIVFLLPLWLLLSCTKNAGTVEETITPTAAEKKVIDAAVAFFKNNGDYYQIVNNYRVALGPVLTVTRALMDGPCTTNVFQTECCCPWNFSMTPYDAVNGNNISYNYPKSVSFTAKTAEMNGSIAADFSARPVAADRTDVQYNNLAFGGTNINLNGMVSVKNVIVSPFGNNVKCTAEFSDNSFTITSGPLASVSGNLSFTDGDASGKLDITYADNRKIVTEIILTDMVANSYAGFIKEAGFTMEGITARADFIKATITVGDRTFKLSL